MIIEKNLSSNRLGEGYEEIRPSQEFPKDVSISHEEKLGPAEQKPSSGKAASKVLGGNKGIYVKNRLHLLGINFVWDLFICFNNKDKICPFVRGLNVHILLKRCNDKVSCRNICKYFV